MTLFPAGLGSFTNNCDHTGIPGSCLSALNTFGAKISAIVTHIVLSGQCRVQCPGEGDGAGVMDTIDISNAQMLRLTTALLHTSKPNPIKMAGDSN